MSNSFYYFFSATPQVLGGVLALFGVFVIFKIQTIKTSLLSVGEVLNDFVWSLLPKPAMKIEDEITKERRFLQRGILKCLQSQNIKELDLLLNGVKDEGLLATDKFNFNRGKYLSQYQFLQSLISDTVKSSIITAVIIVASLLVLPFGHILSDCKIVVYILFGVFLIGIIISFANLINVLKKSLMEE